MEKPDLTNLVATKDLTGNLVVFDHTSWGAKGVADSTKDTVRMSQPLT